MRRPLRLAATLVLFVVSGACFGGDQPARGLPQLTVQPTIIPDRTIPPAEDGGSPPPAGVTRPIPGSQVAAFPADADDRQIVGRVFGSGQRRAVVLMHASGTDMRSWFPFAERLQREGYTVLAFDFRGRNQSRGPDEPVNYPHDALGALAFIEAAGAERVALVGVGIGGTTAVVASQHSDVPVTSVAAIGSMVEDRGLDARDAADALRRPTLVVDVGAGGERELARLIEDATLRRADGGRNPARSRPVQDALLRFLNDSLR